MEQPKYGLSWLRTRKTSDFNPAVKVLIHFEISKSCVSIAVTDRIRSEKIIGGPIVARNQSAKRTKMLA